MRHAFLLLPLAMLGLLLQPALAATPPVYLPMIYAPPRVTTNLEVASASYMGGSAADSISATAIAPDGSVLVAGTLAGGFNPGAVTPTSLLGGGDGALVRLAADGRSVRSLTRIGGQINDMEINDAGALVVCGDFGIALLSADASQLIWNATPGDTSRCAIGSDGTSAALADGKLYVYNLSGQPVGNWNIGGTSQRDIAVDGASGAVFATGYTQKNVAGYCSGLLQVPFIKSWGYNGSQRWVSYDWSAQQAHAQGQCADSRGYLLAIGGDHKLYYAGYTDGGNSVYSRDPRDISKPAALVKTDKYNDPYNMKGAKSLTWYGRFDPGSGALEAGQFLVTRLNDGSGNSSAPYAITADTNGTLYLAGEQYAKADRRDERQVAGVTVGNYEGGEGFLLVVSADFKQRLVWTPFAAPGSSAGGSPGKGVAVRGSTAAFAITLNQTSGKVRTLITANALQPNLAAQSDGYLVVFPAR